MNRDAINRMDALRVVQEARERGIVDLREVLAEIKILPAIAADEYTAFLEAEIAKTKTGHCPNCNATIRPLHCCACEGCDGCREVTTTPPTTPSDAAMRAARNAVEELKRDYLLADPTPEELNEVAAIITKHFSGEGGEIMGHLYTEASAVIDKLSTDLSALRADVKLMRPVVDAAVAYTVEFPTGMTDEALLRLSVAVNAYRSAAATTSPETPEKVDDPWCDDCRGYIHAPDCPSRKQDQ